MNIKEQLNGIIIRYKTVKPFEFYNGIGIISTDEKDKDWLIEQAEKVEQLEHEIKRLETEIHWTSKAGMRNETMLKQRLKQA
jgi:archaellum component FlaC